MEAHEHEAPGSMVPHGAAMVLHGAPWGRQDDRPNRPSPTPGLPNWLCAHHETLYDAGIGDFHYCNGWVP